MNLIDLHCDTISILSENNSMSLYKNNIQVDIQKLLKANSKAQFFAIFIDILALKKRNLSPFECYNNMLQTFLTQTSLNSDFIKLSTNYNELQNNFKNNKISAFLTIEDGGILEGSFENLNKVYDDGVRLITLTWNYENELGYPNSQPEFQNLGLKDKGIYAIEIMNSKGMLVDVSHLSDGGFYDAIKYSKKPLIASHSNCRFLKAHPRNLTDDMIRALSNKGGVMGLNFCSFFLGDSPISRINDMVSHIKHIKNVGGIDSICIGSDFDGIFNDLEIPDISNIDLLLTALSLNDFTDDEIEKIWYKNAQRIIKDVLI